MNRGKKHTVFGMDIEIKDDGTMSLVMHDYLVEIINTFGEDITHKAPTPASNKLFEVNLLDVLSEKNSETFHHIVAKLLYVSKRAQADLNTTITFLCTRVSKSTVEDWEKICRILQYLKGTINMKNILGANGLDCMSAYVDTSYKTYMDIKGYTGV